MQSNVIVYICYDYALVKYLKLQPEYIAIEISLKLILLCIFEY